MNKSLGCVLAILDRPAEVLQRTLSTYAYQTVQPADRVLLDYGSRPDFVRDYQRLCDRFGWRLVSCVPETPGWHLSAAYNAAVAALDPRIDVVFKGDVDVMLGQDVLETALAQGSDKLCIFSCLAVQEGATDPPALARHDDLAALLQAANPPREMPSEGFHAYPRAWFAEIGGFDLAFVGLGYEDSDLRERAKLSIGVVYVTTCLLIHQWHPVTYRPEDAERNRQYYRRMSAQRVLVRNGGMLQPATRAAPPDRGDRLPACPLPPPQPDRPAPCRHLNLGCGHHLRPGWLNIDCRRLHPESPEFMCCAIADLDARIADGTIDGVDARHLLACLPWREVDATLIMLVKKLRPGGTLSFRVPDAKRIARAYASGKLSHHAAQRLLFGEQAHPADERRSLWSASHVRNRLVMVGLEIEEIRHRRFWLIVRGRRVTASSRCKDTQSVQDMLAPRGDDGGRQRDRPAVNDRPTPAEAG